MHTTPPVLPDSSTLPVSNEQLSRWQVRLQRWSIHLQRSGLQDLVVSLLEAGPLSMLGAQLLWVAQPALSLFMPSDEIDTMAQLLQTPTGMAWVRSQLQLSNNLENEGFSSPSETE